MQELATILAQPITQLGGLVGIVVLLQKAGVDIGAILRSFLGVRGVESAKESDFDTRQALQTLLFQNENLLQHFNHDTTAQWDEMLKMMSKMNDKIDESNQILKGVDKYGIKCRKD